MQHAQESRPPDIVEGRLSFSDFALRVAGPADGRLEASIDGAAYRPLRYAEGYWWYHWSGTLEGCHHMVVIVRSSAEERAQRA
jgi:hypothetical protein